MQVLAAFCRAHSVCIGGGGKSQKNLVPLIEETLCCAEQAYLTARTSRICECFPGSLGMDDFLTRLGSTLTPHVSPALQTSAATFLVLLRLEIALFAYGFTGENSIGDRRSLLPISSSQDPHSIL